MTLIELSDWEREMMDALTHVRDDGDPITEEEQNAIIDQYIAADEQFKGKLDRYAAMMDALNARAAMRRERASAMAALAGRDSSLATRLKDRVHQVMKIRGEKKIETDERVFTVCGNGGKAPVVVPDQWRHDPASAPEEFHRHRIELDVAGIGAALESGAEIEGCAIGARGTYLRIK